MNDPDSLLRDAGARLRDSAPSPQATEAALQTLGDVDLDTRRSDPRRRIWIVAPAILATAAAAVIGVVVLTNPSEQAIVPATTGAEPTPGPTTVTPTSPTTSAVAPATTTTPTTNGGGAPSSSWVESDEFPVSIPSSSNYAAPASPAVTSAPDPLSDGLYQAGLTGWSADEPDRLQVSVGRFVPCLDDPTDCTDFDGDGTFGADEAGRSLDERALDVTLDQSVGVVVIGIDAADPIVTEGAVSTVGIERRADGTALTRLLGALTTSYDEVVRPQVEAGSDFQTIADDLIADPRNGFSGAAEDLGYPAVLFTAGDAPGVLMSSLANGEFGAEVPLPLSGIENLVLEAIGMEDGTITLYFYAGPRS